jgi:hypothetical protein
MDLTIAVSLYEFNCIDNSDAQFDMGRISA